MHLCVCVLRREWRKAQNHFIFNVLGKKRRPLQIPLSVLYDTWLAISFREYLLGKFSNFISYKATVLYFFPHPPNPTRPFKKIYIFFKVRLFPIGKIAKGVFLLSPFPKIRPYRLQDGRTEMRSEIIGMLRMQT